MSIPTTDERLHERLAHLPDACRAVLAAVDRRAIYGGGEVVISLHVEPTGRIWALSVPVQYIRRS